MKPIFPTLLLYICTFALYAQKPAKPCKPKVKANRDLAFEVRDIGVRYGTWDDYGKEVRMEGDSIVVRKNGSRITGFKVKNGRIAGDRYMEYYPNGTLLLIDSLADPFSSWYATRHYSFEARVVYMRTFHENGMPDRIVNYRKNGEDSLRRSWYADGVLRETVWCYPSGYDSARYEWNREGILQHVKIPFTKKYFYADGTLQSVSKDTMITGHPITRTHEYYPSGILKSVTYYNEGSTPCHVWLYYTEQGTLAQTVKKTPIDNLPTMRWGEAVQALDAEFFAFVEMLPQYPGGEKSMESHINKNLAQAICESPLPLEGTYEIRFMVMENGVVKFESVTGKNAEAIAPKAEWTFNHMPQWKPGLQRGKKINSAMTVKLTCVKTPKT